MFTTLLIEFTPSLTWQLPPVELMTAGLAIEPIIEPPGYSTTLLIALISRHGVACVLMITFDEMMRRVYVPNLAISK